MDLRRRRGWTVMRVTSNQEPGTDLDTLCDLGFLRRDTGWFKLTDKAERLVEALKARQDEAPEVVGHCWIVVANCGVFIDEGATPPNLRALMSEEWKPDYDRMVITYRDREYLLVSELPRLARGANS